MSERRYRIAADHPSLTGHFPGDPIVPGVVILEEVVRACAVWRPADRPIGIATVKFLLPLRPEQAFSIRFEAVGPDGVRFECIRADGQPLASGRLTVMRADD